METTNVALELSRSLEELVEHNAPSVVRVEGRRGPPSSGIVWSADGVAVTSNHVLEWEEDVEVGLPDGRTVRAEIVGRDPTTDVAALRLEASGLVPAGFADAAPLRIGQLVLAVSRPGRGPRAQLGLIARLGDAWRTPAGGKLERYVELDLGLQPGFSGSLVLDLEGRGIGLASAGLVRREPLAVPAAALRRVMKALLTHGGIRRGFLGIATIPVRLPATAAKELGQPAGLLVTAVEEASPAARAGLLIGDLLLSFDGRPLAGIGDLLPLLEEERIGDEAATRVLRAGEVRDLRITIGVRDAHARRGER